MAVQSELVAVPLMDVVRDNAPLHPELIEAATRVITSGHYIGGAEVQKLEQSLATLCGTPHAIACASGSDALLLALMALDVQPGDEVLLPSFTFFATASCVTRLGATPVFVDIDPVTFNMDPARIESLITDQTRVILPVHLFGLSADMDPILDLARRYSLRVVEDCAQSIGATSHGRPSGSMGDIGCLSFYPTKNLGGFGDGGALVCNDPAIADRIRLLANHGMRPRYYHQAVGINSRLDAMQAALLNVKVPHLAGWAASRQTNAQNYLSAFADNGLAERIGLPGTPAGCGHVWNQFTVRIPGGQRDAVRQQLADAKIGSEVYYPVALHQQECFREFNSRRTHLPHTEQACREVLSLPIFPGLRSSEQERVIAELGRILAATGVPARKAA